MIIFGTRPEAIKMAPLVKELENHSKFETIVCVTGQHKEMLEQVLLCFNIKPKYDLAIMKTNQTLFDVTMNILDGIKVILLKEQPDIVLVHGDTTTTFATGLASFYLGIPVGHVEAGLRTYDMHAPFPEEFNRQSVGLYSSLHFAPTELAKANLLRECKKEDTVFVTGNTAIDALSTTIKNNYSHPVLDWAADSRLILLTAHRRENLGEPLYYIFRGIKKVLDEVSDLKIVYPIHLNPIVRKTAREVFGEHERIQIIEPLDVLDFHNFLNKAYLILTDSGGIQEEAPGLGKPVLVLREVTERPEGIKAGTSKLIGTDENRIYKEFKEVVTNKDTYISMSHAVNPYGDGKASSKIAKILEYFLS